jgi:deoxyguanosinetriphosphate triphosphohydrolase, putative
MIQTKFENDLYRSSDIERRTPQGFRIESHARDDFERDYGRVVHSAAFRRLQSKTQVIGIGQGDFHRTRLTHSIEVSQIARGIVLSLNEKSEILNQIDSKIDSSLIEAAALAHDFGHPPFGHQGERALNEKMTEFGGFEGNAQTFRILTRLERGRGLNLTRATMLAILKYPIVYNDAVDIKSYSEGDYKPPKASIYKEDYDLFQWLIEPFTDDEKQFYMKTEKKIEGKHLKTKHKTLECSIIELADDIAYSTHDLEDALKLKLIEIDDVNDILEKAYFNNKNQIIKKFNNAKRENFSDWVKDATADLISIFISNVKIEERVDFESPRIRYGAYLPGELVDLIEKLKNLIKKKVIGLHRVQTIEWKGGQIIRQMFDAFYSNINLLPEAERSSITEENKARVVCDYIAGMTDSYALRMY